MQFNSQLPRPRFSVPRGEVFLSLDDGYLIVEERLGVEDGTPLIAMSEPAARAIP